MLNNPLGREVVQWLRAEVLLELLQGEAVLLEALAENGRDLDEGVLSGSDVEGLDHQAGGQLGRITFK